MVSFRRLFDSARIGTVAIKNRIAMTPMSTIGLCSPDGTITQRLIDYYVERAKGAIGLIITGGTKVENEIEKLALDRYTLPTRALNERFSDDLSTKLRHERARYTCLFFHRYA